MKDPVKNITWFVMSSINRMKNFGYDITDYEWLEQIAIEFYQLNLSAFEMPSVVVSEINVNPVTRIWPMPVDYVRYTKVAYKVGKRIWTLGLDNTLALDTGATICESIETATANDNLVNGGFWLAEGYYNGYYVGPVYTAGGGFNINYYRVNDKERLIQFSENLPNGKALIEYISSGKNVCGNTLVPLGYGDAFQKYMLWQMCELKPELQKISKDRERQYKDAIWDANILVKAPTIDEAMDAIYSVNGFNIR